jgi:O-antigen/teichoic acid export membrane protein
MSPPVVYNKYKRRIKMKNVYKSIVVSVLFGNIIAFPVVAYSFPWETYLIDPSTYYIVQSASLGLLIAACIFTYEWVKYAEKPWTNGAFGRYNKKASKIK